MLKMQTGDDRHLRELTALGSPVDRRMAQAFGGGVCFAAALYDRSAAGLAVALLGGVLLWVAATPDPAETGLARQR